MTEEGNNIISKTWSRAIEPVNKMGYMDGASDGQVAAFQASFDVGYEQGFSFGFNLGLNKSASLQDSTTSLDLNIADQRRINCQICAHGRSQESVTNLYNIQQENNFTLLKNHSR